MPRKKRTGKKKHTPKKTIKPVKKSKQPKKVAPKQIKRGRKPKVKKSYRLYLKGKPLDNFYKGAVKEIAEAAKINVSTPEKLHKFYNDNYEKFEKRFTKGETTFKKGTPEAIADLEKLDSREQQIYVQIGDGKNKQVTLEDAVYEITMTERYLNRILDTTGFTISFVRSYDGKVNIKLPPRIESPEWLEESVEDIVEFLFNEYNIVIYISEPSADTSDEKKEQIKNRKDTYSSRIEERKFIATQAIKTTKTTKKKSTSEKKKRKRRK